MLFYRKNSLPHGMHGWKPFGGYTKLTYANYPAIKNGFLAIKFPLSLIGRRGTSVLGFQGQGAPRAQHVYLYIGLSFREYTKTRNWGLMGFELSYYWNRKRFELQRFDDAGHSIIWTTA